MRKILLFLLFTVGTLAAQAQSFTYYPSTFIKASNGHDTLVNAFAGGLNQSMFNNMDLNGDGLQDLVVFDRRSFTITCFLAKRYNRTDYIYRPEYAQAFPLAAGWMWMVDYNKDGKPDIFTITDPNINFTGLTIYKNISTAGKIKFKLEKQEVKSRYSYGIDQIVNNATEIPAFVDVDGDGDIDMLTYSPQLTSVRYYKNFSKERYKSLDSFDFELKSQCWGSFYEYQSGDTNVLSLGYNCAEGSVVQKKEHAGSSLLAYDFDNDGDIDLVIGDAGSSDLNLAINERNPNSANPKKKDTIGFQRANFPFINKIELPYMPQPCMVDIDNDGVKDLVVSPADLSSTIGTNFIWYYRNQTNNKEPVFSLRNKNFLTETMIDPGNYSAPSFCDFNHDGLQDMVLAVSARAAFNDFSTSLFLYENTGTKSKAFFTLFSDDYLNLTAKGYMQLKPCFADLDGDGMEDLIAGTKGNVLFFKNIGTTKHSEFAKKADTLKYTVSGQKIPIYVYSEAAPAAGDIDGDGRLDLLIGSGNGRLYYFKNTSTSGNMDFTLVTDTFGQITSNNPAKLIPCLKDLDNNGHLDLLLGNQTGTVWMYKDIALQSGKLNREVNPIYNYYTGGKYDADFGYASAPAATDLDGDSISDIVIGNFAGGVQLLTSINHMDTFTDIKPAKEYETVSDFKVYPNPASQSLTVTWQSSYPAGASTITILDVTGRECLQNTTTSRQSTVMDIAALRPGVYIVRLMLKDGQAAYSPLIIQR